MGSADSPVRRDGSFEHARAPGFDPGDDVTLFVLPYVAWIRLFRSNGLVVEDLIEQPLPEDATSTYRNAEETAWARRWPMEQLWKVRKSAG